MPSNVVETEKDEELWNRAKKQAEKQSKGENYAYIMSIYKKMNPDRFANLSAKVLGTVLMSRAVNKIADKLTRELVD